MYASWGKQIIHKIATKEAGRERYSSYKGGKQDGKGLSEKVIFELPDAEEVSARSTGAMLHVRCLLNFQMNMSNRQLTM